MHAYSKILNQMIVLTQPRINFFIDQLFILFLMPSIASRTNFTFFVKFSSSLFSKSSSSFNSAKKSVCEVMVSSKLAAQLLISEYFPLLLQILSTKPERLLAEFKLLSSVKRLSTSSLFLSSLGRDVVLVRGFFYPKSTQSWCYRLIISGQENFQSCSTFCSIFLRSTFAFNQIWFSFFGCFSFIFSFFSSVKGINGSSLRALIYLISFKISCLSVSANFQLVSISQSQYSSQSGQAVEYFDFGSIKYFDLASLYEGSSVMMFSGGTQILDCDSYFFVALMGQRPSYGLSIQQQFPTLTIFQVCFIQKINISQKIHKLEKFDMFFKVKQQESLNQESQQ